MIKSFLSWLTVATELSQTNDTRLKDGIIGGVFEALLGVVPYVCLYFVMLDLLHNDVEFWRLATLFFVMFVALIAQIWLGTLSMINIMIASYALFGAARMRVAEHIRKLPMGWFTNQRSGALLGVLTTDMNMLSEIWSHFIAYLSGGVMLPTCVGIFLMFVDWRLGLITLATLPLAFLFLALGQVLLSRLTRRMLKVKEEADQALVEYVRGIAVLRAFGRFGEGYQKVTRAFERLYHESLRTEILPAPLMGVFGFTVEAGFSLLVLAGAWMLTSGLLNAEIFLLFMVISVKFYGPLYDMGVAFLVLRFARQALERTHRVIETPILPEVEHSVRQPDGCAVSLERVCFAYEGQKTDALEHINVTFPMRQLSAIVGPSGSGKSTLVHLIARLWDVKAGSVQIGGVDVRELSGTDLHSRVAMVFQDVVLFSGSIAENIRIGRQKATFEQVVDAAKKAQIHGFIESLPDGYETLIGEGGRSLSGGEMQRISIARALLKDADIVLLDEATASVDPGAESAIQHAIDELVRHKTVIVIAHRLRTIQRAAQIVVLDKGRIREVGSHDALVERDGLYADLWRKQSQSLGFQHRQDKIGGVHA